jgi:hypothetical protein
VNFHVCGPDIKSCITPGLRESKKEYKCNPRLFVRKGL